MAVLGTDRDLQLLRRAIDAHIARLTAGSWTRPPSARRRGAVMDLLRQRRIVDAVIANRRREASKPIVSFVRWRYGDGALLELIEAEEG